MFSVKVHTESFLDSRITLYLVFETYSSAINCKTCLEATEPGRHVPEDYFEAASIRKEPTGEIVNHKSIETDWVLVYNHLAN